MQYVLILVALILLGGGYYVMTQSESGGAVPSSSSAGAKGLNSQTHTMEDGGAMSDEEHAMMMEMEVGTTGAPTGGVYEVYAPEKVALAEDGPVVLYFRASWCPTCQAADRDIRASLADIPAGVTILDVDYDNSAELKKKYGVTYQHTFVQVDAAGVQIKKWSGSRTLEDILKNIQQ